MSTQTGMESVEHLDAKAQALIESGEATVETLYVAVYRERTGQRAAFVTESPYAAFNRAALAQQYGAGDYTLRLSIRGKRGVFASESFPVAGAAAATAGAWRSPPAVAVPPTAPAPPILSGLDPLTQYIIESERRRADALAAEVAELRREIMSRSAAAAQAPAAGLNDKLTALLMDKAFREPAGAGVAADPLALLERAEKVRATIAQSIVQSAESGAPLVEVNGDGELIGLVRDLIALVTAKRAAAPAPPAAPPPPPRNAAAQRDQAAALREQVAAAERAASADATLAPLVDLLQSHVVNAGMVAGIVTDAAIAALGEVNSAETAEDQDYVTDRYADLVVSLLPDADIAFAAWRPGRLTEALGAAHPRLRTASAVQVLRRIEDRARGLALAPSEDDAPETITTGAARTVGDLVPGASGPAEAHRMKRASPGLRTGEGDRLGTEGGAA